MPAGRNRVQVNRQRLGRARDLLGVVRVTVFSPDDLTLVKGGAGRSPAVPRRHARGAGREVRRPAPGARPHRPPAQHAAAPGRRPPRRGGRRRRSTCGTPSWPTSATASATPGRRSSTGCGRSSREAYDAPRRRADRGRAGLRPAVAARRAGRGAGRAPATPTCERGVSTVGPHRDELALSIAGLPARTHASQGEQRTLGPGAAAGRPPPGRRAHRVDAGARARRRAVRARPGSGDRAARHLPRGQVVITTAAAVPAGGAPERVIRVVAGSRRRRPAGGRRQVEAGAVTTTSRCP